MTPLNRYIGYENAAEIAKQAVKERKTIRQVVHRGGLRRARRHHRGRPRRGPRRHVDDPPLTRLTRRASRGSRRRARQAFLGGCVARSRRSVHCWRAQPTQVGDASAVARSTTTQSRRRRASGPASGADGRRRSWSGTTSAIMPISVARRWLPARYQHAMSASPTASSGSRRTPPASPTVAQRRLQVVELQRSPRAPPASTCRRTRRQHTPGPRPAGRARSRRSSRRTRSASASTSSATRCPSSTRRRRGTATERRRGHHSPRRPQRREASDAEGQHQRQLTCGRTPLRRVSSVWPTPPSPPPSLPE